MWMRRDSTRLPEANFSEKSSGKNLQFHASEAGQIPTISCPGSDLRKFFWSVFGRSHMINDSQSWVGRTNFRAWIPPGHPLKSNPAVWGTGGNYSTSHYRHYSTDKPVIPKIKCCFHANITLTVSWYQPIIIFEPIWDNSDQETKSHSSHGCRPWS